MVHYSSGKGIVAAEAKALLQAASATVDFDEKPEQDPYRAYIVYTWEGRKPDLAKVVLDCLHELERFRSEGKISGRTERMPQVWRSKYDVIVYLLDQ